MVRGVGVALFSLESICKKDKPVNAALVKMVNGGSLLSLLPVLLLLYWKDMDDDRDAEEELWATGAAL